MQVYVGQTRSRALCAELSLYGFGEMTNRNELPPRRLPFALDNGAFRDFRAGRDFDETAFLRDVERVQRGGLQPDFLVVPDIVAGGLSSLEFSLSWVPRLAGVAPLYLAVQDGQAERDIAPHLGTVAGLFIGGSLSWKIATAASWVDLAHRPGRRAHLGRCGTPRRVALARRIGVDSLDSCLPLMHRKHLIAFLWALEGRQAELFA